MNGRKIALLYLGSRGAGLKFTELLETEFHIRGKEFIVITRNKKNVSANNLNTFQLALPRIRVSSLVGIGRKKALQQIIGLLKYHNVQTVLIPMAHPWDIYFQKKLQTEGIKIIRIIHDASRHPGELWPTGRDIGTMNKADAIVSLSKYTSSLLSAKPNKIFTACHPILEYGENPKVATRSILESEYDLIIGRQKGYQNTKSVARWWMSLPQPIKQERKLVIAGDLNVFTKLIIRGGKDVIFINRWLSDGEFLDLISGANRVICLYKEASQSGVVSAAQSLKVPLLVSDIGGLPDQINSLGGGLVASYQSKADWQFKYEELNEKSMNFPDIDINKTFFKNIFMAIDFVGEESAKARSYD